MSSSPDGQSMTIHTPASDTAGTPSGTTATSGFTAVNGHRSPSDFGTLGSSSSNHTGHHFKMESAATSTARPTSPSEDLSNTTMSSPSKRKRSDSDARDTASLEHQPIYMPLDKRRTPSSQDWSGADTPAQILQRGKPAHHHQPSYPLPDSDGKEPYGLYSAARQQQQRTESPASEARLMEALQRENSQTLEVRQLRHIEPAAAEEDDQMDESPQQEVTSTIETTAAGVQVDPKKRKRIFSNRTKTGCQTCRKRKKKCDEHKPECQNCTRGGFVCEGYQNRSPWQKPMHGKSTPVALQSKKSYGDTGGLMPRPAHEGYQLATQEQRQSEGSRGQSIVVEDVNHRDSWGGSRWTGTHTPTREYLPQRTSSVGYQTGTPLSELSRPPSAYQARMGSQDHHTGFTAQGQLLQQHMENLPNEMGKRNEELTSLPQHRSHGPPANMATAQLALQQSQRITSSPASQSSMPQALRNGQPMSEKDKMTLGEPYEPNANLLMQERDACNSAVWRFNNSQNPSNGVSREERLRLFRQILEPQTGDPRRSANPRHNGHLGQGVVVEAPFACSYGYNIKIGDNTTIGRNCTIFDPVAVSIGARCIIGPNVDIYAGEYLAASNADNRPRVLEVGMHVEIEDDVIIEGRVVIRPGSRIRTGSRVKAGTIVDRTVPAHTVYSAATGEVITGVWPKGR